MKALVVDDSRAMRSILSRILRKVGVEEIDEAGDGSQAVACLEAGASPDVALVDWNMPVMNGLELVNALRSRKEWRRIAIVMISAPLASMAAFVSAKSLYLPVPTSKREE